MKYQELIKTLQALGNNITKLSLITYLAKEEFYLQSDIKGDLMIFKNNDCMKLRILYTQKGLNLISIDKMYIAE